MSGYATLGGLHGGDQVGRELEDSFRRAADRQTAAGAGAVRSPGYVKDFFRPFGANSRLATLPTAYAVGFILAPLCGSM